MRGKVVPPGRFKNEASMSRAGTPYLVVRTRAGRMSGLELRWRSPFIAGDLAYAEPSYYTLHKHSSVRVARAVYGDKNVVAARGGGCWVKQGLVGVGAYELKGWSWS